MKIHIIILFVLAVLCGCTGGTERTDSTGSTEGKGAVDEYNEVFAQVQKLEKIVETADWSVFSAEELKQMHTIGKELYYDYNPMDVTPEQASACETLKNRVKNLREQIVSKSSDAIKEAAVTAYNHTDMLIEAAEVYPVYLQKGETLNVVASSEQRFTLKISNANSRNVLNSFVGKTSVEHSMEIKNTAIYLVEVIPTKAQYMDLSVKYNVADLSRLTSPTPIDTEQVECSKGDFGAKGVPGIFMNKCFEEPRKFTLRGQIKAAFSGGGAKALVAVQVPAGTTDILYSMRIDTSESNRDEDGEFHDNLNHSYTRVKFLGLPLYEKSSSIGLLNTLLDDNRPLRDEDAYCNMYVFRNQAQAKLFQDGGKPASQLKYDVDYSTVGTQSCNGRIPMKGTRTIYLGFENERMRYTNYLWVEVEAIVPKTVYYKTKYSIDQAT